MPAFDVEDVISKLTPEEKIGLLSGIDFWHTYAVPRLGVPSLRTSDGPNGIRGIRFFNGSPAACFPCGTGLAATWDEELIRTGGRLMGEEAIAKGASVILGPTVNMQRSPLGGRGFESYSEDPFLAGTMGAATVSGIQSTGVAATIKHFVCNDQEHERQAVNAIISERALREIYLMPFQIAQRDAKPWAFMTAYNRVNGTHASESPKLLQHILRDEWGFDGLTMSDWYGTYSTSESIKAGLDLEMPGPARVRGSQVQIAVGCRQLLQPAVDDRVRKLLELILRVEPLGIPENAPEGTKDTKETAEMLRNVGSSSIVLCKNEHNVLPFDKTKTIAVIGPNAKIAAYAGGGSANLRPYYAVTPYEGITAQAKDVKYSLGCAGYKNLPLLSAIVKAKNGKPGFWAKTFAQPPTVKDRKPVEELYVEQSEMPFMDYEPPTIDGDLFYIDLEADFTPEEDGDYEFGIALCGTANLYIDGELVVDNTTNQRAGDSFFGAGTVEERGSIKLKGGKTHKVFVQFGSAPTATFRTPGVTFMRGGGMRIGGTKKTDAKTEIELAVQLAKEVEQVVVFAGLTSEWESEGYDRPDMDMPGHIDEMISAVAKANPRTAVVIQSGTPVTMPWASDVSAIVQAWYGGNETGNALADVLLGTTCPSGKLSLSFPKRNEDNPAFLNFRSERGRTVYGEDIYIGYRFYEKTKREVLFPFGHGLSYTSFEMRDLELSEKGHGLDGSIELSAEVTNTGKVSGAQVVQVYISQRAPSVRRPVKELKGFTKVKLEPQESKKVQISISLKYAVSFWDETADKWIMEQDTYDVLVGDSSAHTPLQATFKVQQTAFWKGL